MKVRDGEAGKARAATGVPHSPLLFNSMSARTENARSYVGGVASEELKEIHHTLSADAKRASLPWRKRMS
jgi:hypothetical protein